tara:strand:- start:14351 stop:15871 length:1521 start_codon:yes stop_codon:yes gene_type:complete
MVRETSEVIKGKQVQEKLLAGSQTIFDAVSTTFGPFGRNVAITKIYNDAHITKDGVTVAQSISPLDPVENVATQIIRQAAAKTAEIAGDGTTSTTILTRYIVEEGFKVLNDNKTISTTEIKTRIDSIVRALLEYVDNSMRKNIELEDIKDVALVACNGDDEIAQLVSDAFNTIGKDGIVTVFDSRSYDTTLDATDGIKLDRSHILPILSNGKTKIEHKDCKILTTDMKITTQTDAVELITLQEACAGPLLVICEDITEQAAGIIAYNKETNGSMIEIIRAPFIADARLEALEDLSIATGSVFISKKKGWNWAAVSVEALGSSDRVIITLQETTIIGRKGDKELIEGRKLYYADKIADDKEGLAANYKKRLAMLSAGAAVIYVGGASEAEVKEKKDRFDDTIRAVKSALDQGVVRGGCMAYEELVDMLGNYDASPAYSILTKSLSMLWKTLCSNGDLEGEDIIKLKEKLMRSSIVDPALVIKSTITNAVSAANMLFTTNCVVIKKEE